MSKKYVSKEVAKEIHDKASPVIKWLREAEEESSESDEGEIEVCNKSFRAFPVKTIPKGSVCLKPF